MGGVNFGSHRINSSPARKFKHKRYGLFEILDVISQMAVRLHLPKMWKIHTVFHVSLIESFVKGNRDVNLNAVLKQQTPSKVPPNIKFFEDLA
jgi:hypothetical protein